jgi:formylglycine-generating enzyme required for sulfatase activity/class 3 adenylate cyclase
MAEIREFKSGKPGKPSHDVAPRRLAAIVAGDIAGYSRLMQLDEEGTHIRVKRTERELIEPTIAEHHGRLVKTTGDGFIAIFDSPVEAVRCSIVIQQNLVGRNAALPQDYWMEYRIGVNLGDVIIERDDIYGEGVNVASRLEGLAEPGQVYISGGIYEQIKHKLVCGYESLGDRKVKNITDPVRVYRVLPDAAAFNRMRRRREKVLIFLLAISTVIIAGGALWYILQQRANRTADQAAAPPSSAAPAAPKPAEPPPAVKQAAPAPSPTPDVKEAAPALSHTPGVKEAAPAAPTAPAVQQPAPQPSPAAKTAAAPTAPQPSASVREPEMVALQGGSFSMGSNDDASERPVHRVTVKPFSIGKYPVTVREWNACAEAKKCGFTAAGKEDAPVTNVSWTDAKQYAVWLEDATKKPYRLPSEAEWEFAARGGTQTKYWWGDQMQSGMAGCKDCGDAGAELPTKVGSFKPNAFGLYDMGGGVDQWVEDCWHKTYQGAPTDGTAWISGDCSSHVMRSGSWKNDARYVRPSNRDSYDTNVRYPTHGFRVALSP